MKHCCHFFCSHLGKLGYFPLSLQYYVFNAVRGYFCCYYMFLISLNLPFQTYWSIWAVEYHKVEVACSTSHIFYYGYKSFRGYFDYYYTCSFGSNEMIVCLFKIIELCGLSNLAKVIDKCWDLFAIVIRKLCANTQTWLSFDWNFTTCSKGIVKIIQRSHTPNTSLFVVNTCFHGSFSYFTR